MRRASSGCSAISNALFSASRRHLPVAIDSTATSLFGSDWRVQLEKEGQHWTWGAWAGQQTPGFEVNDFGFLTTGERLDVGASHRISGDQTGRPVPQLQHQPLHVSTTSVIRCWRRTSGAGLELQPDPTTRAAAWMSGRFTFLNNWGFNLNLSYSPEIPVRHADPRRSAHDRAGGVQRPGGREHGP